MRYSSSTKAPYPPGDFAIWLVVYVELITFGAFFIGYALSRRSDVALFNASQMLLDKSSGFMDTLLLLTSGYLIVKALHAIKNTKETATIATSRWLALAIFLGALFLVNKILEFVALFSQGISLHTNNFFMFYFLLTMFHFMHVLLGVIILGIIYKKTRDACYDAQNFKGMETGAVYWHLVDLLWIVLFPLIYIIR